MSDDLLNPDAAATGAVNRPIPIALFLVPLLAIVLTATALRWLPVDDDTPPPALPDLRDETIDARKEQFFDYLRPLAAEENERQLKYRERLQRIADRLDAGGRVGIFQRRWLTERAAEYRVNHDEEDTDWQPVVNALLLRVDAIPVSLLLAQAAKESGWGTSRFAVDANNLFGEWCFTQGCGLKPAQRRSGQRHEVRAFDSVTDSVRSYIMNLNTHEQYVSLRELRAELRASGAPVTGISLAEGLEFYSERRGAYVVEVQAMIRMNELE